MYEYTKAELAEFTHAELIDLYKAELRRTDKGNLIILKLIATKSCECFCNPYSTFDERNKPKPSQVRATIAARVAPPKTDPDRYYEARNHFTLSVKCERCGADPGRPCKFPSGANALSSHLMRRKTGRALHLDHEEAHGTPYLEEEPDTATEGVGSNTATAGGEEGSTTSSR